MIGNKKQTAILSKLIADPKVKTFRLTLRGHSMDPFLKPGTQAEFQKISPAKLPEIGDIAAIKFQNRLLVHRIIRRRFRNRSWEFFTQGDRLAVGDGWITKDKIAGIMIQPAALQSAVYYPQILKLKTAMEAAKINFVFLKGLPLHLYFEKSYPKRILADCDVLIDKKDKSKVETIFARLGYQSAETAYSKIHLRLKDKLTETSYLKIINNSPVVFDIHFEVVFLMNQLGRLDPLYPQKLIDKITAEFLENKQFIKIRRQKFPILAPADLIIYLGLHFFHHNFIGAHRLKFLHKIVGCYRKGLADGLGGEIIDKIKHYRLQNFVYPGLVMLNVHFRQVFPRRIMDKIKPERSAVKYIDKLIRRRNIIDREDHLTAGINRFKNIFYLSPRPWYRKILIFLHPAVIYSVLWTATRRIKYETQ